MYAKLFRLSAFTPFDPEYFQKARRKCARCIILSFMTRELHTKVSVKESPEFAVLRVPSDLTFTGACGDAFSGQGYAARAPIPAVSETLTRLHARYHRI